MTPGDTQEGRRPRILDLFSGAGGSAMGYARAGFDVVGVDHADQPRYPFEFHKGDAIRELTRLLGREVDEWDRLGPLYGLDEFDAIHASPPCQAYSVSTPDKAKHPDLYGEVRSLLEATGLPWVIENVPGAPFRSGITLCGGMFGLAVRRHRNFESSFVILTEPHTCPAEPWTVTGHSNGKGRITAKHRDPTTEVGLGAMGCEWMTWAEAAQAIPPAYGEWIGARLLEQIAAAAPQGARS